jgi:hypothetical protein
MTARDTRTLAALASILALLASPWTTAGWAADERSDASDRPAVSAPDSESEATSADSTGSSAPLGRAQIFEILMGGNQAPDPGLLEHVWQVAGSLAGVDWQPPSVTVRVVASPVVPSPLPH